ncbi:MAG: hypothetical protein KME35_20435 [Aphanocapsa sp. GSE-SYN-MK-11-07L]|jgi:hypothetical protein|nr:hypothetical protein [Aphanocapsa sp. GSE-SYN-MK-11-07L]
MSENKKIEKFQQKLQTNLSKLSNTRRKLKTYYNVLFSIAVISGISATLLAGIATGSKGRIILGKGSEGWQLTCGIIGLLSLTGTVASSFQQHIWVKDKFWQVEESYGMLKSMLIEVDLDPNQYSSVYRDYHRLAQRHPELLD